MARERHGQIIETPTEARQAEPGPSVLALLTASTGLAVPDPRHHLACLLPGVGAADDGLPRARSSLLN